ncbi:MAG: hypothetical protein NTU48_05010 [Legionellales bacterium]|nr:hypothetical protein [Legionellales bacterium]
MRWIILGPLICLITSCIYAEGTVIEEPEDIVVKPRKLGCPCQSIEVTQPKKIERTSHAAISKSS